MIIKLKFKKTTLKFVLKRRSDFVSFYQVYVERSYPHLMELIRSRDTVIDAGANIGIFSAIASVLTGNNGSVIAIEPDPDNLAILRQNVEINNLNNVTIIERALYNLDNAILKLHQNGAMSKIFPTADNSNNGISVKTTTLDDLIAEYEVRPSVMKMDIEGAEFFALQKATNLVSNLNYFEGEIHDLQSELMLRSLTNFDLTSYPIENMKRVKEFVIRHPVKTLRLEYSNRFETTKRILSHNKSGFEEFPKMFFGRKRQ